jgi:ParB family transcriptional regulator, chromosome partitioning protein
MAGEPQMPDEENAEVAEETETSVPGVVPVPPPFPPVERFKRHHVAPAQISLDRVDADETFRMRPAGEIDRLAQNVARLGQLFPVDLRLKPPDRFQVICGFRRVEALRFLQRDRVLARLHTDLTDEDALLMALSAAIDQAPVSAEELAAVRERLEREGRLTPAARDMLEKAAGEDELAPETVPEPAAAAEVPAEPAEAEEEEEEEVDADELAKDATLRMAELNQDLALLADVFSSLEPERKRELLQQLRYSADLVAYLESKE